MPIIRQTCIFFLTVLYVESQDQIVTTYVPGDFIKYPDDYCKEIRDYEEFDFIVVGAGPAGSAVARRLAEIPTNKVLLLEAGGDPPPISDIPAGAGQLGPEIRWNFQTKKDQYVCLGFNDEVCHYKPGKVLGGCSIINAMMGVRGNPEDFEEWKRMGNYGWGYQDVLPYFKKLENYLAHPILNSGTSSSNPGRFMSDSNFTIPKLKHIQPVSSAFHSSGGPLSLSEYRTDPHTEPLRKAILDAFQENGIPFNNDINSNNQMGITNIPGMVDSLGYRNNAAKAYLLRIPDNLKVCKNALVHKVNLDASKTPIEVTSVQYEYSGRMLRAIARKEYIISGGALNSPGILERSGIGIPEILTAAGVKPILNLQVGENYQEQFGNWGSAFLIDSGASDEGNPLTIGITSLTAFVNVENPRSSIPDVQYLALLYVPGMDKGLEIKPKFGDQLNSIATSKTILILQDAILRQTKIGSVHIKQSLNPLISPEIVSNQLATRRDVDITVKSTRLARKIMSNKSLGPFKVQPFVLKECQKFSFNSEEEIMCGARLLTSALYHQGGTCSMGSKNGTVVDPQLRVIGTKNLRVVDTSIMPLVTRGNTELPTLMIGEKAADLIKLAWGQI